MIMPLLFLACTKAYGMGAFVSLAVTRPAIFTLALGDSAVSVGGAVSLAVSVATDGDAGASSMDSTGVSVSLAISDGGAVLQAMRMERVKRKNGTTARLMTGMKLSGNFHNIVRNPLALSIGRDALISLLSSK